MEARYHPSTSSRVVFSRLVKKLMSTCYFASYFIAMDATSTQGTEIVFPRIQLVQSDFADFQIIMQQVDKKIQTEFLKLSPDLRQELWAHATKWLLRNQHPPTPPGRRPIMWEFEADKYYDPKTQDLWGQMARMYVLNQNPFLVPFT